jgi:hypothetical protein
MPHRLLHRYSGMKRETGPAARQSDVLMWLTVLAVGVLIGWFARGLFLGV